MTKQNIEDLKRDLAVLQGCRLAAVESHVRAAIALLEKQEAEAVPVAWISEDIEAALKHPQRDNVPAVLTTSRCAANTVPMYLRPAPLDAGQADTGELVATIMRRVCESDPANPDRSDTIRIGMADLEQILQSALEASNAK